MAGYVLALDQGTTSSRAILFDATGKPLHTAQREFPQIFPAAGLVEHDPEAIWSSQIEVAREVIQQAQVDPAEIAALGITNQRETTIVWERDTGRPIHNAIVWQSRLTAPICEELIARGLERHGAREDGAGDRRLFLGHEGEVAARQRRGGAGACGAGRAALRHGRYVSDLAALRRAGARHRLHERVADADVQHPHAGLGRRPAARAWRAAGDAAARGAVERGVRPPAIRAGSARRSQSRVWRAISRRRPSGRHASRPAR